MQELQIAPEWFAEHGFHRAGAGLPYERIIDRDADFPVTLSVSPCDGSWALAQDDVCGEEQSVAPEGVIRSEDELMGLLKVLGAR